MLLFPVVCWGPRTLPVQFHHPPPCLYVPAHFPGRVRAFLPFARTSSLLRGCLSSSFLSSLTWGLTLDIIFPGKPSLTSQTGFGFSITHSFIPYILRYFWVIVKIYTIKYVYMLIHMYSCIYHLSRKLVCHYLFSAFSPVRPLDHKLHEGGDPCLIRCWQGS